MQRRLTYLYFAGAAAVLGSSCGSDELAVTPNLGTTSGGSTAGSSTSGTTMGGTTGSVTVDAPQQKLSGRASAAPIHDG